MIDVSVEQFCLVDRLMHFIAKTLLFLLSAATLILVVIFYLSNDLSLQERIIAMGICCIAALGLFLKAIAMKSGKVRKRSNPSAIANRKKAFKPTLVILYADFDGMLSERKILPVAIEDRSKGVERLTAWCSIDDEKRTFALNQITSAVEIDTSRPIKDLSAFLKNALSSNQEHL